MKKLKTKKTNKDVMISKKAFEDILNRFNKISSNEHLIDFKNSKALKSILESDKNGNLSKKQKFVEKIFGKDKNETKASFAAQSAILIDIFYLSIVSNNLNKKYDSFLKRLKKRIVKSDPKLHSATELDIVEAVNKIYSI